MFLDSDEFSLGDVVREISVSGVTDTYAYDALNRQVSHTDGRGSTSHTQYNALGLRSASIDALGNRTAYAYDRYGNLSAVTNPLGNAVVYEYDLHGRRTYEGGATYPVRYTYDVFGNKTTMTTYRNESLGPASGDVTTWRYDEASNCMTNKVYADGKGPKYGYTPDGRLAQRIWARGIVTDYSYDGWGSLTNTVYSDGTPTVTLFYDAMGRQTNAVDAAGVTTFRYDDFGSLTNETVVGAAGENTIIRHWDAYGRTAGYTLNNVRQTTIGYDAATGRIATMLANGSDIPFTWSYLPGSDLKSSLAYPNGLTASWTYDANSQLLQVRNAVVATAPSPSETEVISQYDYVYDNAGRRVSCTKSGSSFTQNDALSYGYNEKSELTNAVAAVNSGYHYVYDFDDIGNREAANERGTNAVYMANQLNQYTAVDDFTPQFDDDGNQTLVKTATGIWTVAYNGENRPVSWTCGTTNIVMKYDRMGRRVEYLETVDGGAAVSTNRHHRFVYDGYLCVQRLDASAGNAVDLVFAWDALEKVATKPLMIEKPGMYKLHVTHDGNKNVSELVLFSGGSGLAAHYEYAPFGAVTAATRDTSVTNYDFRTCNPFRFSSEYADDTLGLVYYNYRHYNPLDGRWTSRDPAGEVEVGRYLFVDNCLNDTDLLGMRRKRTWQSYWQEWKEALENRKYDKSQQQWAKLQLTRGCVGITTSIIGTTEKFDNCYKTLYLAMEKRDEMLKSCECKYGSPLIFSVHFWNDIGLDKKTPDVVFDVSGKADMSNWDKDSKGIGYVNYDFGFYRESRREVIHANHYHNPDNDNDGYGDYYPDEPVTEATMFFSTMEEWKHSYVDFNSEVWCVQCSQRGVHYAK